MLPPTDAQPSHIKGKTPITGVTLSQLRRRKIEAVKLALSFVFATKHYLRGEDGIKYDDYADVLPPSFARFDEVGYDIEHTSTKSYSATHKDSNNSESRSGTYTPNWKLDVTKHKRHKSSMQDTSGSGSISPTTPLLDSVHRAIEFHAYADKASLPLPLMQVYNINGTQVLLTLHHTGLRRNSIVYSSIFGRKVSSRLLVLLASPCCV